MIAPPPPSEVRETVRAGAQNRPGVYRMIGPGERVLYIGKSIRLRTRLLAYFRAPRGEKAADIVAHTHRVEWTYVPNEFAALVEEMRAIRRWRPPFNVQHKRDRGWGFIKLTAGSAPRLRVVREPRADHALYFGPVPGPARLWPVVREIGDALQLRDCAAKTPMRFADQIDLFGAPEQQPLCARPQLGRCLAPCAAGCTRTAYRARAQLARRFLEGETDAPLRILRARMSDAATRLQFEYAAELRDRLGALEEAQLELRALRRGLDALSFVYEVPGWDGEDRAYIVSRGRIRAEYPTPRNRGERRTLERVANDYLGVPGKVATGAAAAAEALLLLRWFRLRPQEYENTWRPGDLARNSCSAQVDEPHGDSLAVQLQ